MKKTKNQKKLIESVDVEKIYEPLEAIKILKENSYTKFEETLDIAISLGIDPNKTDQNVRGRVYIGVGGYGLLPTQGLLK